MPTNCVEKFSSRAQSHKSEQAYFTRQADGSWNGTSWGDFYKQCQTIASGLIASGLTAGGRVCLLGNNRPEWVNSCIGTQMAASVSAGIYTACSPEEVEYVINHAEAEFLILENKTRYFEQIEPVLEKLTTLKKIILMEPCDLAELNNPDCMSFADLLALGEKADKKDLLERQCNINPNQLATLIYTSGTTGPPKAVMLSHKNIFWTVNTAMSLVHIGEGDKMVSYLPLAHIAEQLFSVYAPMVSGMNIYYAESMEKLGDNLKEVQPTVFFGVPRVYEKIYEKLISKMSEAKGIKKLILDNGLSTAKEVWGINHKSQIMSPVLKFKYELAQKLLLQKLKPAIGLGSARVCVSGAAPIAKNIVEFFMGLDLPIYEVYGQSEDTGPATFNIPGATRLGTVGRPLPGLQVKIANDGEILVKGPSVFMGYYKNQEATDEVLQDGWLYSGDIGELTHEGYLKITDRKKDIIITAGGKNISPQNIEGMLKQIPLVSSAVVIGDKRKFLSALLTPNTENFEAYAEKKHISDYKLDKLVTDKDVLKQIESEITTLNQRLAPVEQIKKFKLLDHDFSVESGELTPTMKVKRKVVNQRYTNVIESLYS